MSKEPTSPNIQRKDKWFFKFIKINIFQVAIICPTLIVLIIFGAYFFKFNGFIDIQVSPDGVRITIDGRTSQSEVL